MGGKPENVKINADREAHLWLNIALQACLQEKDGEPDNALRIALKMQRKGVLPEHWKDQLGICRPQHSLDQALWRRYCV